MRLHKNFSFFSQNTKKMWILEQICVVFALASFAAVQAASFGIKDGAVFTFVLFLTYLAARLPGGRLCGLLTIAFAWILFQSFLELVVPIEGFFKAGLLFAMFCACTMVRQYVRGGARRKSVIAILYFLLALIGVLCAFYVPTIFLLLLAEAIAMALDGNRYWHTLLFFLFILLSVIGIYLVAQWIPFYIGEKAKGFLNFFCPSFSLGIGDIFPLFCFLLPILAGFGGSGLLVQMEAMLPEEAAKDESKELVTDISMPLEVETPPGDEEEQERDMDMEALGAKETENSLGVLLERLDLAENIRRMSTSAQEDMADVIENELGSGIHEKTVPAEDLQVIGEQETQKSACFGIVETEEVRPDIFLTTGQEAAGLEYFTDFTESFAKKPVSLEDLVFPEMEEEFPEFEGEAELITIEELIKQEKDAGRAEMAKEPRVMDAKEGIKIQYRWIMEEDKKGKTMQNKNPERKYFQIKI